MQSYKRDYFETGTSLFNDSHVIYQNQTVKYDRISQYSFICIPNLVQKHEGLENPLFVK